MKRIELLLNDSVFNSHMQRNAEMEIEPQFCKHDIYHHIDVARIAYILVLEHNDLNYFVKEAELGGKLAAKEVIYAAGLLHDIAKWKEYEYGADHAALGARIARDILPRVFFNPHEVDIICQAVYEHRNISRDMSFLGERIHRADNLSRVCTKCPQRGICPKVNSKEITVTNFEY
ncbi:HD domain-containing protein [Thermosyntropha sp.]|uniref:HD domain-containing protein n=1 Tax=Thermosyntropha sp. TaxID=2740820 RepID=UPI0025ED68DF|nr:HD domain-containing protein [Thermosyntropha sp.]MBO8159754.1 HD domain-containing protein [Thermosyntropha sp.]